MTKNRFLLSGFKWNKLGPNQGIWCTALRMLKFKDVSFIFQVQILLIFLKYLKKCKNHLWILLAHQVHFSEIGQLRVLSNMDLHILNEFYLHIWNIPQIKLNFRYLGNFDSLIFVHSNKNVSLCK